MLRSFLAAAALAAAVATSWSSSVRTLSAEDASLEPLQSAGASAPAQKRFADASLSGAVASSEAVDALSDSQESARVHLGLEPITVGVLAVVKLVGAVAGGFVEMVSRSRRPGTNDCGCTPDPHPAPYSSSTSKKTRSFKMRCPTKSVISGARPRRRPLS